MSKNDIVLFRYAVRQRQDLAMHPRLSRQEFAGLLESIPDLYVSILVCLHASHKEDESAN